jgi:hypothetical protein
MVFQSAKDFICLFVLQRTTQPEKTDPLTLGG